MVSWFGKKPGPIGVDIGSRSVKLLQFDATGADLLEAARIDMPSDLPADEEARDEAVAAVLQKARAGRNFRGREAVLSLGGRDLFVQNLRVPQGSIDDMPKIVKTEAASRIPIPAADAEIRYFEAADVRQGDTMRREVILLACRRTTVGRLIRIAERAQMVPVAIDVDPAAMLRCYSRQFRRDEDQNARMLYLNVGATTTLVVIGRGAEPMFVKYIDVGGRHLDEAVARHLELDAQSASSLRRHDGDRRADQRDPEIVRSLNEAIRPVLEHLNNELAMCIRYYSVTFRGQPLSRVVIGGGEANQAIADWLAARFELPCELGNPLRNCQKTLNGGHTGQWDVAAGLAAHPIG